MMSEGPQTEEGKSGFHCALQESSWQDEEAPFMANGIVNSCDTHDTRGAIRNSYTDEEKSIMSSGEEHLPLVDTSAEIKKITRPPNRSKSAVVFKERGCVFDEETPLLKNMKSNTTNYSQRTARTVGTWDSDEILISDDDREDQSVLGSVVVFKCEVEEETILQEQVVSASVVEEVHDIAEVLLEELHCADEGDAHFLEIALTRNLSILPGDIVDVATANPPPQPPFEPDPLPSMEVDCEQEQYEHDKTTEEPKANTPFSAYVLLLGAVISLSAIGPLLQLQHDVSATLKVVWRMAGTAVVLFPLAVIDVCRRGFPQLTSPQWITFLMSTACYDVLCVGFVLALEYTALGNAVILSNSLCLILLVGKLCVGDPLSFIEGMGALVAFSGAALCSRDSAEARDGADGGGSNSYLGDALALFAALGGVGYLIFAKSSRNHIPLCLFMFLTMFLGCIMILIFQIFVLGDIVTFDLHPSHGLWGWMLFDSDRLPLELAMVLVCNCFGTMGYVRAMQYFDSLVISSAALAEPVVAELIAFGFGVGSLPGFQGWVGNFLVALGTFGVIFEDCNRNKDAKVGNKATPYDPCNGKQSKVLPQ